MIIPLLSSPPVHELSFSIKTQANCSGQVFEKAGFLGKTLNATEVRGEQTEVDTICSGAC